MYIYLHIYIHACRSFSGNSGLLFCSICMYVHVYHIVRTCYYILTRDSHVDVALTHVLRNIVRWKKYK